MDSRKPWGKWDILLASAYKILQDERCPQCGLPVYVCFAGETEVITKDGTRPIRELVGAQILLTKEPSGRGAARWVEAEIKPFGEQKLMRIELSRGRERKEIFATPNHRWFVQKPIKMVNGVRDWQSVSEVPTHHLSPGDSLVRAYTQRASTVNLSPVGVLSGFMFGDGTLEKDNGRIDLFGSKDLALVPYFSERQHKLRVPLDPRKYSDDFKTSYWGFPKSWKRIPALNEGAVFLRSWLAGYFAADGSVGLEGSATLACASRETLERVRDIATICGMGTYSVNTYSRKGIDGTFSNMSYVTLTREHLDAEFFVIPEHRRRFEEASKKKRRAQPLPWKVISVSETDRVEEVFCAVVPGTETFVLKDNILTGNCRQQDENIQFKIKRDTCYAIAAKERKQEILTKGDNEIPPGVTLRPEPYTLDGAEFSTLRQPYYKHLADLAKANDAPDSDPI